MTANDRLLLNDKMLSFSVANAQQASRLMKQAKSYMVKPNDRNIFIIKCSV